LKLIGYATICIM